MIEAMLATIYDTMKYIDYESALSIVTTFSSCQGNVCKLEEDLYAKTNIIDHLKYDNATLEASNAIMLCRITISNPFLTEEK